MKKLLTGFIGFYLLTLATQSGAVILSLEPHMSIVSQGDSVSLDLVINGLGNDQLGDFDLDIGYDSSALSFQGYRLSDGLGVLPFEAVDFSLGEYVPGSVGLAEVSLLLPWELEALQTTRITLATLEFGVDSLATGESSLISIDRVWSLGDAYGEPLRLDFTRDAVVRNVPEPEALIVLCLGLAGLRFSRRNSEAE